MSSLPASVEQGLLACLEGHLGRVPRVLGVEPVSGGCINSASRVRLDSDEDVFVKWNDRAPPDLFQAEAEGLRALAGTATLRIPEVLGAGSRSEGYPGWLALEFVPPGSPGPMYDAALGEGLARLHRSGRHATVPYGWAQDNYIGPLPQTNQPCSDWSTFWRDSRLAPQLERARSLLTADDLHDFDRLFGALESIVAPAEAEGPALLHGDLWSGNAYAGPDGRPVLVDPAVYRGHREVDLAMTELFGGFSPAFYEAYRGEWPTAPGYAGRRKAVYQLYPLLVHVNLFGMGYLAPMRRALLSAISPP